MKKTKEEKYILFKEKLIGTVQQFYGDDYEVSIHPIQKNNGLVLYGLNILMKNTHVCPTIYLEDFFDRYEDGCAFSTIFREIIDIYEKYKDPDFLDLDFFSDYEKVRRLLSIKIINAEYNKELLEDVPYRRIEDLAIVCIAEISDSESHIGSVLIHNNHICMWGIRAQELIDEAIRNASEKQEVVFRPLADVIMEMCDKQMDDTEDRAEYENEMCSYEDKPTMFVLSNRKQIFGASVIAYSGIMKRIGERLGGNYYIIPSSIHELIILPENVSGHINNINEMISSINSEMLSKEEVLSNHAYLYDINSDVIKSVLDECRAIS